MGLPYALVGPRPMWTLWELSQEKRGGGGGMVGAGEVMVGTPTCSMQLLAHQLQKLHMAACTQESQTSFSFQLIAMQHCHYCSTECRAPSPFSV